MLIKQVTKDKNGREKPAARIAFETGISASTALRCLKQMKYHAVKRTIKPGLTPAMRTARYQWCLEHQHCTLEDWKTVIWSDETSVQLGQKRGKIRVWRRASQLFHRQVIRQRWKGFSEFMFWGCFSYDQKGPMHIWTEETPAEKREAEQDIEALNRVLEPKKRLEWELNIATKAIQKMNLRPRKGGRKPQWRWNEKNGKLVRKGKKGINWWRYKKEILEQKLLPFARRCQIDRPRTIVQEDPAPAHAHHYQAEVFNAFDVQRLLWCPNSPDLNAIEPCWWYMKRTIAAVGAPATRPILKKAWTECWNYLPQRHIQQWIERIPVAIQKVIELEGGNEYRESGSLAPDASGRRLYDPRARKAAYEQAKAGMRPGSSHLRPNYAEN